MSFEAFCQTSQNISFFVQPRTWKPLFTEKFVLAGLKMTA